MISLPDLATFEVGSRFEAACGPVTTTQLVRYAGASGDFNRIHYDHHYAVDAKLGSIVENDERAVFLSGESPKDRATSNARRAEHQP